MSRNPENVKEIKRDIINILKGLPINEANYVLDQVKVDLQIICRVPDFSLVQRSSPDKQ